MICQDKEQNYKHCRYLFCFPGKPRRDTEVWASHPAMAIQTVPLFKRAEGLLQRKRFKVWPRKRSRPLSHQMCHFGENSP